MFRQKYLSFPLLFLKQIIYWPLSSLPLVGTAILAINHWLTVTPGTMCRRTSNLDKLNYATDTACQIDSYPTTGVHETMYISIL